MIRWQQAVADPGGPGPLAPIFEAPGYILRPKCTFLHSNNRKIFKRILPRFTRHTISILNWHILIKNIKKLFILRPQIIFWGPDCTFYTQQKIVQKNFALLCSAYYFNSQLTYFDQKHSKIIHFWGPKLYSEAKLLLFTLK